METLKRILAVLVIVVSALFLVACLAGIVAVWQINTPLTATVTGTLDGIDQVLTAGQNQLVRASNLLSEAEAAVNGAEERLVTAGENLSERGVAVRLLERTVGETLLPKIEQTRDTLGAVGETLVAANAMLEAANEIPFVQVPTITEQLETAEAQLAETRQAVEDTRATIQTAREEALATPIAAITEQTGRVTARLVATQDRISEGRNYVSARQTQIRVLNARLPALIDTVSIVLTAALLWFALGQLALIGAGYIYLRASAHERYRPRAESEPASTTWQTVERDTGSMNAGVAAAGAAEGAAAAVPATRATAEEQAVTPADVDDSDIEPAERPAAEGDVERTEPEA